MYVQYCVMYENYSNMYEFVYVFINDNEEKCK